MTCDEKILTKVAIGALIILILQAVLVQKTNQELIDLQKAETTLSIEETTLSIEQKKLNIEKLKRERQE